MPFSNKVKALIGTYTNLKNTVREEFWQNIRK